MKTEQKMQHRNASKAGATCAIAGAALLCAGTYLHPMEANPNEPVAAFTEYAADDFWVASHLMQQAVLAPRRYPPVGSAPHLPQRQHRVGALGLVLLAGAERAVFEF